MADDNSNTPPRPIGTEFEYTFEPANILITRQFDAYWPCYTTYRYRVVGHIETSAGIMEQIEPLELVRRQRARAIYHRNGGMDFEPISDDETLVRVFNW